MSKISFYPIADGEMMELPYADGGVKAGFPSPAQDELGDSINLNKELIRHKESTFFARVDGSSMIDAGLEDGDLLIVDRAERADEGIVCICVLNGDFTVKYLRYNEGRLFLVPANKLYHPIEVCEGDDFEVWGVVTYIIHRPKRLRCR